MYQLAYVSKATKPMLHTELEDLLIICRKNNLQQEITGMLLYVDQCFIQIIEGKKDSVKDLYEKITLDKRHSNTEIVFENTINEREFPDWSMGFQNIENDENSKIFYEALLDNKLANDKQSEMTRRAYEMLIAFRDRAA